MEQLTSRQSFDESAFFCCDRVAQGIICAMCEIRALLLTDVVDSTRLSEAIDDSAMAAELTWRNDA